MRKKTYIIAEIGPNHNGSFQMAKKLVEKISKSGADAIKFQLADPDKVYSLDAFKANYQKKNVPYKSIKEMSSKYQLTRDQHLKISKLCKKKSLTYLCSAFDISSLKFLIKNIKIPIVKIPSGEIISLDILNYLSKSRKKIIISTGMSTLNDIKQAIKILNRNFKKKIILMHCISSYPAEKKSLNLKLIKKLKNYFKYEVGYSDHSLGDEACLAAVAMGARVIEKHVTLSKKLRGPDHKASIEIKEFNNMVKKIRELEIMMGNEKKKILKSELNTQKVARKSIVARQNSKKSKIIIKSDLVFKRPGTGISPLNLNKIIGRKFKKDIKKDRVIKFSDII